MKRHPQRPPTASRGSDAGCVSASGRSDTGSGSALVVVLAMLVLVAGLILAFFSAASQQRQIGSASTAGVLGGLLVESAVAGIIEDLHQEILAGSEVDGLEGAVVQVLRPRRVAGPGQNLSHAPAASPWRQNPDWPPNLLKLSQAGQPFFSGEDGGYESADGEPVSGSERSAAVSSAAPSRDGRRIDPARWEAPLLVAAAETEALPDGTVPAPDWIYVNRAGSNPTDFAAPSLTAMADPSPGNPDFVIGRYAYAVYAVGGLLDISAAGNRVQPASRNAARSRLHQVSLAPVHSDPDAQALPLRFSGFDALVNWRAARTGTDAAYLEDPATGFLGIAEGDQGFLGRLDLLNFSLQPGSPLPSDVLPYLTVFSRDLNAPSHAPDPLLPQFEAERFAASADHEFKPYPAPDNVHPLSTPDPAELNPDLLATRFLQTTTIRSPEGDITVAAGTPVLFRRFPLQTLSLLESGGSQEELRYYFGLERQGGAFRYVAGIEDPPESGKYRIARLEEAAAGLPGIEVDGETILQPREPNFFEILQAVILTGSLGKTAGPRFSPDQRHRDNTAILSHVMDSPRNLQVLQIGANLIDQWDADDLPTRIRFPSGVPGSDLEVLGVENLPYINQFATHPWRPLHAPDRFQLWMIFSLWNPHRDAAGRTPNGISQFRIVPIAGSGSASLYYFFYFPGAGTTYFPFFNATNYSQRVPAGMTGSGSSFPVAAMHGDRELAFHAGPPFDFAEPRVVGGIEPESDADVPGILLLDWDLNRAADNQGTRPNPAIPAKPERPANLQVIINQLYDQMGAIGADAQWGYPYRATFNDGETVTVIREGPNLLASGLEGQNSAGDRVYPHGTVFESLHADGTISPGLNAQHWSRVQVTPTPEQPNPPILVYGNMAAKQHNYLFYQPAVNDPIAVELQALTPAGWIPVQRISGWFAITAPYAAADMLRHPSYRRPLDPTHHSELPPEELSGVAFYRWRGYKPGVTPVGNETFGYETFLKIDPRSNRFGFSTDVFTALGTPLRRGQELWNGSWLVTNRWTLLNYGNRLLGLQVAPPPGQSRIAPGFAHWIQSPRFVVTPYGLVSNHPTELNSAHPMRYADLDGVVRPADGFWGALPTALGRESDRPVVLNRPFRSVGEMGVVFRDLPWKTLDFATDTSGDLGLLDVFTLDATPDPDPLVAGKVNLNTQRPEVLEALLVGSLLDPQNAAAASQADQLTATRAAAIAQAVVAESALRPFFHPGEVVARVLGRTGADSVVSGTLKHERESAIRTLSALGSTATWNLLIDVVAQTGRLAPTASSGSDFLAASETRYWVHVAIDRRTGRVLDMQWERSGE